MAQGRILGEFAELRKATVGFVMFVWPHVKTPFPLDGFSRNFITNDFTEICRENPILFKI